MSIQQNGQNEKRPAMSSVDAAQVELSYTTGGNWHTILENEGNQRKLHICQPCAAEFLLLEILLLDSTLYAR